MNNLRQENKYLYLFIASAIVGSGLTFGIAISIIVNALIVRVIF